MEPETRTLFDAESEVADVYVQTPIPWCTTHDLPAVTGSRRCTEAGPYCLISTGGPDHKWWKDSDGT